MKIKSFLDYFDLNESYGNFNRSLKDSDGLCEIGVVDITQNEERSKNRSILFRDNEESIKLSYVNKAGEELDYIEIPSGSAKIKRDRKGKVYCVIVDNYKGWGSANSSEDELDDFLEGFANYLTIKNGRNLELASGDIETILDILGIPGEVQSIKKVNRNEWEAVLNDNSLVSLKKRRSHDLMSSLKIYRSEESSVPGIHIHHSVDGNKSSFNFSDEVPSISVEEPVGLTQLKSKNPYYTFLLNQCLNRATKNHKDDFINYFSNEVKSKSKNSPGLVSPQETSGNDTDIERMEKALATFLHRAEIEKIYFRNQN
jgi:hypothetical protein